MRSRLVLLAFAAAVIACEPQQAQTSAQSAAAPVQTELGEGVYISARPIAPTHLGGGVYSFAIPRMDDPKGWQASLARFAIDHPKLRITAISNGKYTEGWMSGPTWVTYLVVTEVRAPNEADQAELRKLLDQAANSSRK